jgi:hypothetical protein
MSWFFHEDIVKLTSKYIMLLFEQFVILQIFKRNNISPNGSSRVYIVESNKHQMKNKIHDSSKNTIDKS